MKCIYVCWKYFLRNEVILIILIHYQRTETLRVAGENYDFSQTFTF